MFDPDEQIVANSLRPRDAATLILVKRESGATRVLMGCRHSGMAFMANKYVFPGGRVDPCDLRLKVASELRATVAAKASICTTAGRARGLALAAIRETFEETGVMLGERTRDIPQTRSESWSKFLAHGIVPRLEVLDLVARAITPPNRPRRFDARFFMADASAIAHTLDAVANEELLTPTWLTLSEARALDLPSITRRVLEEVEIRLSDGPDAARPVPFFRFQRGKSSVTLL